MIKDSENNEKNHKNLENNDLNEQIWIKRLDMVFDLSYLKGLNLKENEISEYVDFNKKYLDKIDKLIDNVRKLGYLFVCEPQQIVFESESFYEEKTFKSDIILAKLNKIEFLNVNIVNYGYGDPNKIHDIYELELSSNKGKIYNYEFTGTDIVRFYYQGSIVEKNGDIIAINVQKVMDALNKYYT